MRRRGFTIIELMITMAIFILVFAPFLMLAQMAHREFAMLVAEADLKATSEGAAWKLFRRAAATGGYRLEGDNHGLAFPDGSTVRWEDESLVVREPGARTTRFLEGQVADFAAVRRDGFLYLTLVLRPPGRPHSLYRAEYRWGGAR